MNARVDTALTEMAVNRAPIAVLVIEPLSDPAHSRPRTPAARPSPPSPANDRGRPVGRRWPPDPLRGSPTTPASVRGFRKPRPDRQHIRGSDFNHLCEVFGALLTLSAGICAELHQQPRRVSGTWQLLQLVRMYVQLLLVSQSKRSIASRPIGRHSRIFSGTCLPPG